MVAKVDKFGRENRLLDPVCFNQSIDYWTQLALSKLVDFLVIVQVLVVSVDCQASLSCQEREALAGPFWHREPPNSLKRFAK